MGLGKGIITMMVMFRSNWRAVCVWISTVAVLVLTLWIRDARSSDKNDNDDEDRALVAILWFRFEEFLKAWAVFLRSMLMLYKKIPPFF